MIIWDAYWLLRELLEDYLELMHMECSCAYAIYGVTDDYSSLDSASYGFGEVILRLLCEIVVALRLERRFRWRVPWLDDSPLIIVLYSLIHSVRSLAMVWLTRWATLSLTITLLPFNIRVIMSLMRVKSPVP